MIDQLKIMGKMSNFRNLHKEYSSRIPTHWIYLSVNPISKLLSADQIALNNCIHVQLAVLRFNVLVNNISITQRHCHQICRNFNQT